MDKKEYRRKIFEIALAKTRKKYDAKADIVKAFLGILFFTVIIISLVLFGLVKDFVTVPALILSYFGGAVLSAIATYYFIPIRSYMIMWDVAAERDALQEKDKLKLKKHITDIENSKPVIFIEKVDIQKGKGYVGGIKKDAIYIEVKNKPKIKNGNPAEKVYPTVTWYDMSDEVVTVNSGRWHIGKPNQQIGDEIAKQTVDLDPNGNSRILHFALDNLNSNTFSAYSRGKDGNDELLELKDTKYKVKIHLQSNNYADADFECIVEKKKGALSVKESLIKKKGSK